MAKALVAYFSASGVTKRAAETLAQAVGADLFEIAPATPYTAADLDWTDPRSRSSLEHKDDAVRPALAAPVPDLAAYDVVFVGFPVWWYIEPRIVDTFLEAADFAGKTIVPFATSGGSGLGQAPARMLSLAPGAKLAPGRMLNGRPRAAELKSWGAELGL